MVIIIAVIGVVAALVLLLLQSNEHIFDPNAPHISFVSLFVGIGISTFLLVAVVHVFWSPDIEDDPYYGFVFLASCLFFVMLCVISVAIKVFYDYVMFPFFRKTKSPVRLQYAITTIKRFSVGGLLVFFVLTVRQTGINENRKKAFMEQRELATLGEFEKILHISLHHDARIISHDFMYACDGYGDSLEIEGNKELIQKLARAHRIVVKNDQMTFEEPYGRGRLRGTCVQQDASIYSCSLNLSGSSGR